jgi:phenylalanine-4-hydroxylase
MSTTQPEPKSQGLPTNQERINALPDYLKQFIVDQNYDGYTPIDHAVWRFVMRQNYRFLRQYAHLIYFEGLEKTGIGIERIPSIERMNEILGQIGWSAVCVNGFIPPAAFMAFQARRILVIAADMRQVEHIEYTPSPDIIHEAAGHAPCIADREYADYLRRFGEVGSKAMMSRKDYELYEAIRHLSILKEAPDIPQDEIDRAEADVLYKQENLGKPSEMALLTRLHWWTVEYGLIGTLDQPKIYGAGLLSSIGEAASCLKPEVTKIPYSIDACDYAFDITSQQPQLFVAESFTHVMQVLNQFAETLAYNVGGSESVRKAIECERTSTVVYSSGLQVSGHCVEMLPDGNDNPAYIRFDGKTALAFDGRQLDGQGVDYHRDGFSSPVGNPIGFSSKLEEMTDDELEANGIKTGVRCELTFAGGIVVAGLITSMLRKDGRLLLLSFDDCRVTLGERVLFDPSWGVYDMAVGQTVVSVFAGPADQDAFEDITMVPKERVIKVKYTDETKSLHALYQEVRVFREGRSNSLDFASIWDQLQSKHQSDWLLAMELYELLAESDPANDLTAAIKTWLESQPQSRPELRDVITNGIALADEQTS